MAWPASAASPPRTGRGPGRLPRRRRPVALSQRDEELDLEDRALDPDETEATPSTGTKTPTTRSIDARARLVGSCAEEDQQHTPKKITAIQNTTRTAGQNLREVASPSTATTKPSTS